MVCTCCSAWDLSPSIQLYPTPSLNCSFCLYKICCINNISIRLISIKVNNIYGIFELYESNYLRQVRLLLVIKSFSKNPFLHTSFFGFDLVQGNLYFRFIFQLRLYEKVIANLIYNTIFHSGSIDMATLMNSLSRNGTRASTPQAEVALLALKQSYW